MTIEKRVRSAMKAVIKIDNRILMLKQQIANGNIVYDLPGGKVEHGEDPLDCLVREVKEEVYLDVNLVEPVGIWYFFHGKTGDQINCMTYECEIIGNQEIDITKNPTEEKVKGYELVSIEQISAMKNEEMPESLQRMLLSVYSN